MSQADQVNKLLLELHSKTIENNRLESENNSLRNKVELLEATIADLDGSKPITLEGSYGVAYGMPLYDDEDVDVVITEVPASSRIKFIQFLRDKDRNTLPLKEYVERLNSLPFVLEEQWYKPSAELLKQKLEAFGVKVELK